VLRDRGTRIISVSDELAARVAPGGPAVVLPNGISPAEWYDRLSAPAIISELAPPIITYAGIIDERLDVNLIENLAADSTVGSIALIGPCDSLALRDKLGSIPKVALCGLMPRGKLRGALMHSDVCIIPHVISPLTTAMSPLKLYEYLAAGKPVVTTQLEPARGVSKRVISAVGDDFPEAVRTALRLPDQPEDERREFLRSNSWAARHERMFRVMLAGDADWQDA
jgi:glycosyltransferase involved in cell wall biosynthesis